MPSALWSVRTALVDLFTLPLEALDIVVFDGQRPRSGDTPKRYAVIGAGDDPFDAPLAADEMLDTFTGTFRQEWAREGPGSWRREAGGINCSLVAWSGDDEFEPLRASVESMLDVCESALLDDRDLGGLLVAGTAEIGEIQMIERRTTSATAVGALFTVAYQSLLT